MSMDVVIQVAGLELHGFHGVEEEERVRGQPFLFDVTLAVHDAGARTDKLVDTVDYNAVVACVQEVSGSTQLQPDRGARRGGGRRADRPLRCLTGRGARTQARSQARRAGAVDRGDRRADAAVDGTLGLFRRPFAELLRRQLDLYASEHGDLIEAAEGARTAWSRAPRADAEERYADYLDAAGEARDALALLRDGYLASLESPRDAEYTTAFDRAVAKRWPSLAVDPDAGLFDDLEGPGRGG